MKKSDFINADESYVAPCCNVMSFEAEGVLCQSGIYGNDGEAGGDLYEDEYGIY
ncbi:MAG: hypothetical protein NC115_09650 [Bacteroidales bacterium]|nr:hypothetical protein [Bacteroides sp.]MCM1197423.1 hypothetical protein [Clostridium sp.]MCM1502914.1 hypothetical protein [Bacteroidales bacterium]